MTFLLDIKTLQEKFLEIEHLLGFSFKNRSYLIQAFIHSSYINEHKDLELTHNERLEFLGDSILNILIAEYLYDVKPPMPEGQLSQARAFLVASPQCLKYIEHLGVDKYLLLGRGEKIQATSGRGRETILADLFEALLGAIYLDQGLEAVRFFFFTHFAKDVQSALKNPTLNWKALLQEYLQSLRMQIPEYRIIDEVGPHHERNFLISVASGDKVLGSGMGSSKKQAEQLAAKEALLRLNPDYFSTNHES